MHWTVMYSSVNYFSNICTDMKSTPYVGNIQSNTHVQLNQNKPVHKGNSVLRRVTVKEKCIQCMNKRQKETC